MIMKHCKFQYLIFIGMLCILISGCGSSSSSNNSDNNSQNTYPNTGTWYTPESIDTFDNDTGSSFEPQIATDSNGNAIAVWSRSDGTDSNIWVSQYMVNSGWGDAHLIENNDSNSYYPDIVIDNYGNAIVVWYDNAGIWAARYEPNAGWGTPRIIGSVGFYASAPNITVNPSGDATVVWNVSAGEETGIWSNSYTINEGWGNPEMIGVDGYEPEVALDDFGNRIVVWTQWRHEPTTGKDIWANHYIAGAGWTGAVLISSGDSTETDPKIAFDAVGRAILVSRLSGWGCYDTWMFGTVCGSQSVILARHYTQEDGWGGTWSLSSSTSSGDDPRQPQIAIDTNGNAIAVWSQGAYLFGYHSQDSIYACRYTPEIGWSGAERINPYLAGTESPQISFDSNGNAMVVWKDRDGHHGFLAVIANQYTVGRGWGEATYVEEMYSGSVDSPQVAIDVYGSAIVVWLYDESYTGQWNVWANRFDLN